MIEINLLPEELRKKRKKASVAGELSPKKAALIGAVALLALQFLATAHAFYLKSQIGSVTGQIARLNEQNKQINVWKNELKVMDARIKESDTLTSRNFRWASLLNSISDSITRGVWLSSLSLRVEERNITPVEPPKAAPKVKGARAPKPPRPVVEKIVTLLLEGSAVGQGEETAIIGKFIKELKNNKLLSELFEDVRLSTINQRKIRDFDVYDFALSCQFKKGKA